MTGTNLTERLARLGEGEVGVTAPVPEEIWTRGRRRARRARALQAAGALCVVLTLGVGVAVVTGVAPQGAAPVSAERPAVLPDELLRDLPTALPDLGRGEVIAIGARQRMTGHLFWEDVAVDVVGVQAATGRYGVIALPGRVGELHTVALSPDGARLAYWRGDGETMVAWRQVAHSLVVLDLVSGEETVHEVESEHGILPDDDALTWVEDSVLLVRPWKVTDAGGTGARARAEWAFLVDADGRRRPAGEAGEIWPDSNAVAGRYLGDRDQSEDMDQPDPVVVDLYEDTVTGVSLPSDPQAASGRRVNTLVWDGGDRVAGLADPTPEVGGNEEELTLVVSEVGSGSSTAWRDVVAQGQRSALVGPRGAKWIVDQGLAVVAVAEDGTSEELTRVLGGGEFGHVNEGWFYATGLLATAEVVDPVAPQTDPLRWVAQRADLFGGGLVLLVLVGVLAALGLRGARVRA